MNAQPFILPELPILYEIVEPVLTITELSCDIVPACNEFPSISKPPIVPDVEYKLPELSTWNGCLFVSASLVPKYIPPLVIVIVPFSILTPVAVSFPSFSWNLEPVPVPVMSTSEAVSLPSLSTLNIFLPEMSLIVILQVLSLYVDPIIFMLLAVTRPSLSTANVPFPKRISPPDKYNDPALTIPNGSTTNFAELL